MIHPHKDQKEVEAPHRKVFIITGKVGSGKSTLLGEISKDLQQLGISMDGFLCRGELSYGERSGYTMVNVRDGSEIIFAKRDGPQEWPSYGRFCFNPEAFTEGENIIRKAIDRKSKLLIIDEVGPLELEQGGWSKMMDLVPDNGGPVQIWVVRESILSRVMQRWNIPTNRVISIGHENKEEILKKIIADVRNDESSQAAQSRS